MQHCAAGNPVEDHFWPHYHPSCAAVPWSVPVTHPVALSPCGHDAVWLPQHQGQLTSQMTMQLLAHV